ncbi:MAG: hypothetical protein IJQ99_08245 [Synergistaceae bacterium]|nr:hypothetical protein [Synergistaceae bacterium]
MLNKKIVFTAFLLCFSCCSVVFANSQVRIGVMQFLSRTDEVSESQAVAVTDMITRILHSSPSIAVIERERLRVIAMEQGLNVSNNDSLSKLGQISGCQYVLLGAVTQLTQRYLSSLKYSRFLSDSYFEGIDESQETTAKLEARLIDVATGRVVLSFSQGGSAIVSSKQKYSRKDLVMRAIEAASSRLCDEVRKVLVNEYSTIIAMNKNNIRINRGRASGVNVGSLYKVYQEGEEIFDLNGKYLGKREVNLALLRVVSVQNEFAVTEIVDNDVAKQQDIKKTEKKSAKTKRKSKKKDTEEKELQMEKSVLIREGDKIEAISFAEAEKLKLSDKRIGEEK